MIQSCVQRGKRHGRNGEPTDPRAARSDTSIHNMHAAPLCRQMQECGSGRVLQYISYPNTPGGHDGAKRQLAGNQGAPFPFPPSVEGRNWRDGRDGIEDQATGCAVQLLGSLAPCRPACSAPHLLFPTLELVHGRHLPRQNGQASGREASWRIGHGHGAVFPSPPPSFSHLE